MLHLVEEQVHHPQQVGQGFLLDATKISLERAPLRGCSRLRTNVLQGFDQEASSACRRVQDGFTYLRIHLLI